MKKIKLFSLLVVMLLAGSVSAQEGGAPATSGEKKGWPSFERYNFIKECIGTAKVNLSEDAARFYCYCMQDNVEKKYPTIEDAEKITAADMESPAWKSDVKACLSSGWTAKERNDFISDCVRTATEHISKDKASNYCECMAYKVEKAYPNFADTAKLTDEKLASPEWKKIIQDCLEF